MQATSPRASVLHVRSGSASGPISKYLYLLRAPLRWWKRSSHTRAVEEIHSLPRRIQATRRLNTSLGGRGYLLPARVEPIPYLELLDACKMDMEELRTEYPRMTSLDRQMAVAGWAKGLQFALRSDRKVKPFE